MLKVPPTKTNFKQEKDEQAKIDKSKIYLVKNTINQPHQPNPHQKHLIVYTNQGLLHRQPQQFL